MPDNCGSPVIAHLTWDYVAARNALFVVVYLVRYPLNPIAVAMHSALGRVMVYPHYRVYWDRLLQNAVVVAKVGPHCHHPGKPFAAVVAAAARKLAGTIVAAAGEINAAGLIADIVDHSLKYERENNAR